MTVSTRTFRDVMACLAMPVAVVSTVDGAGRWHGATVGSVVSLSLDPPLVMFAVRNGSTCTNRSATALASASASSPRATETAERFAGNPAGRFAADIVLLKASPVVGGALGWLVCGRSDVVEAGITPC